MPSDWDVQDLDGPDSEEGNEFADDEAGDEDDASEVLACPACGAAIFEDAPQCPACGDWVTPTHAWRGTPLWVRVTGAVLVVALLGGLTAGVVHYLI